MIFSVRIYNQVYYGDNDILELIVKFIVQQQYTALYPEWISYWLTSMGTQKNVPKKQKIKLLILTSLFVKRKFKETHK